MEARRSSLILLSFYSAERASGKALVGFRGGEVGTRLAGRTRADARPGAGVADLFLRGARTIMATSDLLNVLSLMDDAKCFAFMRERRWPEGVRCPGCDSGAVIRDGCDDTQPCRQRYRCKDVAEHDALRPAGGAASVEDAGQAPASPPPAWRPDLPGCDRSTPRCAPSQPAPRRHRHGRAASWGKTGL